MRLSEQSHWDSAYEERSRLIGDQPIQMGWRAAFKKMIPRKILDYMSSYDQYLLWEVIYPKHMPRNGIKALEVGSAPGHYLVKLSKKFAVEPYGVEYSKTGTILNKRIFEANQLDPENIICSDFFADDFQNKYAGFFDVVISRGFIEHFTDVDYVIDRHINLLKKGGLAFVTIPNYRGLNYMIQYALDRNILNIHNLGIMDKNSFLPIFQNRNLDTVYCDYWGVFSFNLFAAKGFSRVILGVCERVQLLLNIIFRATFGDKGAPCRFTSAHLIYIGKK